MNPYVIKALENYPYDLEEALEALNYALSYDDKNVIALLLMGRFYAETVKDYEMAKSYFVEALAENVNAVDVYAHYIDVLIWNEDFEEVRKLIDFALTVKGIDKALIYWKESIYYETIGNYKSAKKSCKKAKFNAFNNHFLSELEAEEERLDKKIKGFKDEKEENKQEGKAKKKKKK